MKVLSGILRSCLPAILILTVLITPAAQGQGLPGAEASTVLLETLDPLSDVILPRLYPVIAMDVSPALGDATLINRINFLVALGMVDAAAPYHPTAVGMYTHIPRRPITEWTDRYINTAMLHAAYHTLVGLLPDRVSVWREMLTDYGLDPADESEDLSTSVGIGNVAGKGALAGRMYDGMNQTGDYQDTTGYEPVNTAFELRDPSRWQPGMRRQGTGVYTVQQFVTPQLANTEPMAEFDPRELRVPPPTASDTDNWREYKAQVDAVLEVSANLSDEQKLKAELFDNKIVSLSLSYLHLAQELNLSPADTARGYFVKLAAALDSSVVIWQEKARFDAVRPFSAIRYVYGDRTVAAWGGPGLGSAEIPADQWQSYMPEADHPEYPSGSTCGCYAQAQALRRFSGSDELNWSVSYPAGSSRIEPGFTPAQDLTLRFETWTDFASDCAQARVWGGVHFPAAVEASAGLCSSFGDLAYEYYETMMDGTAAEREPAEELDADPWLLRADAQVSQSIQVPEPTTPTPEACEAVSDSILVTSMNSSVECVHFDTSGLQLLTDYVDAVSISGELDLGAQVCFRDNGSLILLEDSGATPTITQLATYSVADMTCGWLDRAGTVVLMSSSLGTLPAGTGADSAAVRLADCQLVTQSRLKFRVIPAGDELNVVIPIDVRLTATARTAGWFQVDYNGRSGWISADHVSTRGDCR